MSWHQKQPQNPIPWVILSVVGFMIGIPSSIPFIIYGIVGFIALRWIYVNFIKE